MGPNIQEATARVGDADAEIDVLLESWPHDANSEYSGVLLVDLWTEDPAQSDPKIDLDLELEITPDEARQLALRLIECAAHAEERAGHEPLRDDHEEEED